jgi:asparagine synthase (glutamine-hydrolysing)
MCGLAGIVNLDDATIPGLRGRLAVMNRLIEHRGPDDEGTWVDDRSSVGLTHRRLSIIDPTPAGHQPMVGEDGSVLVFNGELYNYRELRPTLEGGWRFRSGTDTEVLLASYASRGEKCLEDFRGMFAFAIWDGDRLFCARDHFGIKPFYYAVVDRAFYFASEIKALVPFLPDIATDEQAIAEYLVFQYTIGEKTLFKGVQQLLPGHALRVEDGKVTVWRYWDVHYDVDFDHSPRYFTSRVRELLVDSLDVHLRSDVPVGSYISGGIDSTLVATLAAREHGHAADAFHGRFLEHPGYDESAYAHIAADAAGSRLHIADITAQDFVDNIERTIYHLDHPVAGPGSFPQFMVSRLAADSVKVVLGGQGGDEVFGGYARYLIAYLEQCIRAAIDGSYRDGNFVVTAESIIPNLTVLQEYAPLIKKFWSEGLFGALDERYFRLIDRSVDFTDEVDWSQLDMENVFTSFRAIFNSERNVSHQAYFDSMTHFDFKTLLPALLHVEDRMSMAHGLESRVPILDRQLIEFAATVPADVKFRDGQMKHLLKIAFADVLPPAILQRRDKMGFPVPLNEWFRHDLRDWINDVFRSPQARSRPFVNTTAAVERLDEGMKFGRKAWALLSLELWQQAFHDRAAEFRKLVDQAGEIEEVR